MQQTFEDLLKDLHYYPHYFQACHLRKYLSATHIKVLQDAKVLVRGADLHEVQCPSCDDTRHYVSVYFENGRYYCKCPKDILPNPVEENDVATWNFDVEAFLRLVADRLDLKDGIEELSVPKLWLVGYVTEEGMRHYCYYYQGGKFSQAEKFIKSQPAHYRYIVFTNKEELCEYDDTNNNFLSVPITAILSLKQGKLCVDKRSFDQQRIHGFRAVIFKPETGELFVNQQCILRLVKKTNEYYFVLLLWQNFNQTVLHETIEKEIYDKTGRHYEDTASKLCHKLKGKIKKNSFNKELIDQIFIAIKNENTERGYIMQNPI